MKNKILSAILVLSMLVGLLAVVPMTAGATEDVTVWDGSVATSFAGGNGTESNPYQISNGAELALMADKITNKKDAKYNKAFYVLTADITLNTGDASTWKTSAPANEFTPIGTWSNATSSFGGSFDGQGHTISGMYVSPADGDNYGLFGAVQGGATIKNLALVNSYVYSKGGNVAALVGTTDRSSGDDILVENVFVNAYVYGDNANAGGIFGTLSNTQNGYIAGAVTLSRVTFTGVVEGTNYVAGLIADARSVIFDVDDCLVLADIRATNGGYAAGLVARSNNTLNLISQYDQTITNSIVAGGSVSAKTSGSTRAFITASKNTSKPFVEYSYNAISGLGMVKNADTDDEGESCADIQQAELYGFYEGDTSIDWEALTEWAHPERDIARPKGVAENFEIYPYRELEKGSGTAEDPYLIEDAEDLQIFSELSQSNTYEGAYFELAADITLEGENNHKPIGNWSSAFGGTFDGKGHIISGMNISSTADSQGLFGVIQGGATIKNVVLVDAYVAGGAGKKDGCTAALVGQTNRGNENYITIENVYVDATVVGNGEGIAGILGNASDSNDSYTAGSINIKNTVFSGSIETNSNLCAGFVGCARNVTVTITKCANYGNVTTTGQYVAGFVAGGANAYEISNSISAGVLAAKSAEVCAVFAYNTGAKSEDAIRSVTDSYHIRGIANNNLATLGDESITATVIENRSELIGAEAMAIDGWVARNNDFIAPAEIADFLPEKEALEFTVIWQNHDSTILSTETYVYGSLLEYKGDEPTKEEDDKYLFRHNGWKIGEDYIDLTKYIVTEDVTLVADFYRERKPVVDNGGDEEPPVIEDETDADTDIVDGTDTETDTEAESESEDTPVVEEKSFLGKIFDAIFNFFKGIIDTIFGKKD